MATSKKKVESRKTASKPSKPSKKTPKTAPAPAKIVLSFKCKKDHTVNMQPDSLRVSVITRDVDDKVAGIFRTNNLCPICLVDVLNSNTETFPVIPTEGA